MRSPCLTSWYNDQDLTTNVFDVGEMLINYSIYWRVLKLKSCPVLCSECYVLGVMLLFWATTNSVCLFSKTKQVGVTLHWLRKPRLVVSLSCCSIILLWWHAYIHLVFFKSIPKVKVRYILCKVSYSMSVICAAPCLVRWVRLRITG